MCTVTVNRWLAVAKLFLNNAFPLFNTNMQIGLLQMLDSPLMVYVVQYHGIRIVSLSLGSLSRWLDVDCKCIGDLKIHSFDI